MNNYPERVSRCKWKFGIFHYEILNARLQGARAFTLVELLVGLCVIAVLVALGLPGMKTAWQYAQTMKCANNLRSWHNATVSYLADNNQVLPVTVFDANNPSVDGGRKLGDYMNIGPYAYDMARYPQYYCSGKKTAPAVNWNCYGYNSFISQMPIVNLEQSRTVWMLCMANTMRWVGYNCMVANTTYFNALVPRPHRGKLNLCYLDGHIVTAPASQIPVADFTRGTSAYWGSSQETTMLSTSLYDK